MTGNLRVVDWNDHVHKWPHLQHIDLPKVCSRPIVDLLIGMDYQDLHFSLKDVRGNPGEPMARLTPLGWTCIGHFDNVNHHSNFAHAYFINDYLQLNEINSTFQRFWEEEEVGHSQVLSHDDLSYE